MTKTKIVSAMLSAILLSGSTAVPVDVTQDAVSAPAIYETNLSVGENQLAVEAEYEANAKFTDSKSAVIEAAAPEAVSTETTTTDLPASIAPAICCYFVKPGDQQVKAGLVINWTDFQVVTETYEGEWTVLTGYIDNIGDWTFKYTADGDVESSEIVPLDYYFDDYAIGLPLACNYGPTTVEGWTFMAEIDNRVCYSHASGTCYVFGDGWDAIILDARRYAEWKNGENFHAPDAYTLVAYNSESWVIASEGAPRVVPESVENEMSDIDALTEKITNRMMPLAGVSDPKWGAIDWADFIVEEPLEDNGVVYHLDAQLNGCQFSIEIDDEMPLGFAEDHEWSAAIISSDFVTHQNDSVLHYGDFAINVVDNNVSIVNTATDEVRNVTIERDYRMDSTVTLLTLTDGKHAKCVTCRPELIAIMYALSSK